MNFKSFIIEETLPEIKLECSQFVAESEGLNIYRGITSISTDEPSKLYQRESRNPIGMGIHQMELFNKAFEEIHGIADLRAKGVFATGNKSRVDLFGNPFKIYPSNDYTYWWSPEVKDLNNSKHWDEHTKNRFLTDDVRELFRQGQTGPYQMNLEIYYDWEAGEYKNPEIDVIMLESIKEFIQQVGYKNTNLVEAIKSGVEVIFLCKSYWAVPINI